MTMDGEWRRCTPCAQGGREGETGEGELHPDVGWTVSLDRVSAGAGVENEMLRWQCGLMRQRRTRSEEAPPVRKGAPSTGGPHSVRK